MSRAKEVAKYIMEKADIIQSSCEEGIHLIGKFPPNEIQAANKYLATKARLWVKQDGSIYITGPFKWTHACISGELLGELSIYLNKCLHGTDTYAISTHPRCQIDNGFKAPDGAVYDLLFQGKCSGEEGNQFPTFIIEVAIEKESLSELNSEIDFWFSPSTSVQAALGIKVFKEELEFNRCPITILYKTRGKDIKTYENIIEDDLEIKYFEIPIADILPGHNLENLSSQYVAINLNRIRTLVLISSFNDEE